jgi:16S rRNA (guanine(966)-N(2))-methyltransferase RsmD
LEVDPEVDQIVRIISGSLKGRRLETPDWPGLRPTSDKLRETLFNILAPRIGEARVLDGYAGTGAVGIEALSRGAAHVTFVERDARAVRLIERNLAHAGIGADRRDIIRADLAVAVRRLPGQPFDLIFLDPPYGAPDLDGALRAVEPIVAAGSRLVVEHAARDAAPPRSGRLTRIREVRAGDSSLAFYEVQGGEER